MATRRFKISVGEHINDVVEEAGAAVNSDHVELTVELANTAVNTASGTRTISKEEVLLAIEQLEAYIQAMTWQS